MTMTFTEKTGARIDWHRVQRNAYLAMGLAFSFAAGGWWRSIDLQEATIPYRDRATHQLEKIQAQAGANPIGLIQCLHRRADLAEENAEDALALGPLTPAQKKTLLALPACPHPKILMNRSVPN